MKYFLALLLLISSSAMANSGSGNISNVLNLGGVATSDSLNIGEANSQGYFTVNIGINMTSGNFYPFFKNGTQYQVTSGTKFHVSKICAASATATNQFQLVSSQTQYATNAGSITSGTYQSGVSGTYPLSTSTTAWVYTCYDTWYDFASLSYPGIQGNGAVLWSVWMTGREY